MGFNHKAVYGMTTMGKTWLMKRLAAQYAKRKQQIIVYSGVGDFKGWPKAAKLTADVDELEALLRDQNNFGSFVFLDEITVLNEDTNKNKHPIVNGIFMRGRHFGYTVFGATQYPTAMNRKSRVNCGECYCFKLGDEDSAKQVWNDYGRPNINNRPAWEEILKLNRLEFLHMQGGGVITKKTL